MHRQGRVRDQRTCLRVAVHDKRRSGRKGGWEGKVWPDYEGPCTVCPENLVWVVNLGCSGVGS